MYTFNSQFPNALLPLLVLATAAAVRPRRRRCQVRVRLGRPDHLGPSANTSVFRTVYSHLILPSGFRSPDGLLEFHEALLVLVALHQHSRHLHASEPLPLRHRHVLKIKMFTKLLCLKMKQKENK